MEKKLKKCRGEVERADLLNGQKYIFFISK
jgi:hypothetical protein